MSVFNLPFYLLFFIFFAWRPPVKRYKNNCKSTLIIASAPIIYFIYDVVWKFMYEMFCLHYPNLFQMIDIWQKKISLKKKKIFNREIKLQYFIFFIKKKNKRFNRIYKDETNALKAEDNQKGTYILSFIYKYFWHLMYVKN